MRFLPELDMDDPKQAKHLETVLAKARVGKVIVALKQAVKIGVDENGKDVYDGKDVQVTGAAGGCLIDKDKQLIYITMRDLKRPNIKAIQNIWKTVRDRGMTRYLEGKENDYYMTLDCQTIEESKKKCYTFGTVTTPLFCSSDGDEDLCLAYLIDDCFIDISHYDKKLVEYEAVKLAEQGKNAAEFLEDEPQEEQGVLNDSVLFRPSEE